MKTYKNLLNAPVGWYIKHNYKFKGNCDTEVKYTGIYKNYVNAYNHSDNRNDLIVHSANYIYQIMYNTAAEYYIIKYTKKEYKKELGKTIFNNEGHFNEWDVVCTKEELYLEEINLKNKGYDKI